jgi:hypothetical protein
MITRPERAKFVIPAKAGIHRSAIASPEAWIPAFAGMTVRSGGATRPVALAAAECLPHVIPAKAELHRSAIASPEAWTPAFAGVTR